MCRAKLRRSVGKGGGDARRGGITKPVDLDDLEIRPQDLDDIARVRELDRRRAVAERARTNLSRYFSPDLVGLLAERDEPLGPVRRETVAVLFADIVGFTRMAESMAPEDIVTLLREFHERMAAEIFACGGTIEKYIGDAIFAVFGLLSKAPDDAAKSLACAHRMLEALGVWNRERERQGHAALAIGIGINYGPAVVGDVGSKQGLSFTVIGDTVNTASRLQGLTRELGVPVVVGDALVTAIAGESHAPSKRLLEALRDLGEQTLRGRSAPIRIWCWRSDPSKPTAACRLDFSQRMAEAAVAHTRPAVSVLAPLGRNCMHGVSRPNVTKRTFGR